MIEADGMVELTAAEDGLRCRLSPSGPAETLIYLPGLHGDWTLLSPFRRALEGRIRLVEFTYPRLPAWRLDDYSDGVLEELKRRGVAAGWLLAESFSSQVAWGILRRLGSRGGEGLAVRGVILVGGFVRHPMPWGVALAEWSSRRAPLPLVARGCGLYARMAARRGGELGRDRREFALFAARRSVERDRAAVTSRYGVIRGEDLRPVAREYRGPVYGLSGGVDPIVPWPLVWRWLRQHCPGFRGAKVRWGAGHNVLLDAPEWAATQVLNWVG